MLESCLGVILRLPTEKLNFVLLLSGSASLAYFSGLTGKLGRRDGDTKARRELVPPRTGARHSDSSRMFLESPVAEGAGGVTGEYG